MSLEANFTPFRVQLTSTLFPSSLAEVWAASFRDFARNAFALSPKVSKYACSASANCSGMYCYYFASVRGCYEVRTGLMASSSASLLSFVMVAVPSRASMSSVIVVIMLSLFVTMVKLC